MQTLCKNLPLLSVRRIINRPSPYHKLNRPSFEDSTREDRSKYLISEIGKFGQTFNKQNNWEYINKTEDLYLERDYKVTVMEAIFWMVSAEDKIENEDILDAIIKRWKYVSRTFIL